MLSWSSGNASGKQFYLHVEVSGSNPGEYEVKRKKGKKENLLLISIHT